MDVLTLQIRIARFLAERDRNVKDRILSEFGWTWRQTANLQESFDNKVRRLIIMCGGDELTICLLKAELQS